MASEQSGRQPVTSGDGPDGLAGQPWEGEQPANHDATTPPLTTPGSAATVGLAPLRESMEFAPGHFWTYRETPYESSIECQCKWGWRWNQPWGGRDAALATYRDHARSKAGWTPIERGMETYQGSSM